MHPRILILVAVFVAAAIAVSAAGATAAGVAPWSNAKLTRVVKQQRLVNIDQRLHIQDLEANVQSQQDHYSAQLVALLDCIEQPEGAEDACIAAAFSGVVR